MNAEILTITQTSLIFITAGIFGASLGFGFAGVSAIAVAILGVREGFPVVLLAVLAHVAYLIYLQGSKLASWRTYIEPGLLQMNLAAICGVPSGMLLLFAIPQENLKYGLGIFVLITAFYFLHTAKKKVNIQTDGTKFKLKKKHAVAVGFAGGLTAGFASFPLAPVVAYGQSQGAARSNLWFAQPFALVCQIVCIGLLFALDKKLFLNSTLAFHLAFAIPCTLLGTKMGKIIRDHMDHKINDRQFARASAALLVFCGTILFIQPGVHAETRDTQKTSSINRYIAK